MSGVLTHLSAGASLEIKPAARWAVERKFRSIGSAPSTVPFTILLLDRQYYLAAGSCFVRHVRQVHHRDAATKLSQVNVPFDGEHESLAIHWIRIWRGGEPIELIENGSDLELQPSESSNRLIAHLDLKDLRPDDAIDIAYTTTAHEPDPNLSVFHPILQRVPMLDWNLSAITPHNRPIAGSSAYGALEENVRRLSEGSQFHHWHASDLPAAPRSSTRTPAWYNPSPELQLSTFQDWSGVAQEIFRRWQIQPASPEVTALAQTFITDGQDMLESARLACRFVQEKIATTAPAATTDTAVEPGASVLERQDGDAKSKAALLVALLREIGIPSAPVVVSRSHGRLIREALPAISVFDHVIVRARFEDTDIWIDPTATNEEGPVTGVTLPVYGFGLQVSPRAKNLCSIPKSTPLGNHRTITEHFVVDASHACTLSVTTRAAGTEANQIRAQLTETEAATISPSLADLQHRFPGTSQIGQLEVDDQTTTNEIVLKEQFQIPSILRSGSNFAHFFPSTIQKNLPVIPDRDSDHPVALTFPCNLRQVIVIDTPWSAEPYESGEQLPGTGFAYSFKAETEGRRHTLRYAYDTLDDHIVPLEFDSAKVRLGSLRPQLDYRFKPPIAVEAGGSSSSGKGSKIIRGDSDSSALRQRNNGPKNTPGLLLPILGAIAAIALFLVVRSALRTEAVEKSSVIREKQIAEEQEKQAIREEEAKLIPTLPDNPLEYLPPLPLLKGPEKIDEVEFGIGDGAAPKETKASEKKNATSADWKLGS